MSDEENKSWIYAGGIPYELTEGDIICVFSQYGEIFEISLSRDKETGKSRGFCFLKYEDPRSCELAVDNLNGSTIVGRKIKVSLANNTGAVRARKPAFIAPNQDSTMPIVDLQSEKDRRIVEPNPRSGSSMLKPDYWKSTTSDTTKQTRSEIQDKAVSKRDHTRARSYSSEEEHSRGDKRRHQKSRDNYKFDSDSDSSSDSSRSHHKSSRRSRDRHSEHKKKRHRHDSRDRRKESHKKSHKHKHSKKHHKESHDKRHRDSRSESRSSRADKRHKHSHKSSKRD